MWQKNTLAQSNLEEEEFVFFEFQVTGHHCGGVWVEIPNSLSHHIQIKSRDNQMHICLLN